MDPFQQATVHVYIFFQTALILSVFITGETQQQPLYVLSLLPYSDSNGAHGWDRGLELLPTARVAVKHINNRTDILPGYEIRLIERASDACGRTTITKGLLNFVGSALNHEDHKNPIAVVGLACSTVTATVSPIAGRSNFLQMAMASSMKLRDKEKFPHLWRFLSSSDQLVRAFVEYMKQNDWDRVGMIADGVGFFFQAIAQNFRESAKRNNFTIVVDEGITSSPSMISSVIERIKSEGVRIILASTTIPESIEIMCQAAKHNLVWPGYVWIFPSSEYIQFFLKPNNECVVSKDSLMNSLENVMFVDFELNGRSDNVPMVSGKTYSQYRADYDNEYKNLQRQYNGTGIQFSSTYNIYANPIYDELWALALALNSSLEELKENGIVLSKNDNNISGITRIVERNLRSVNFPGTLGRVYFNEYNEVPINVNILKFENQSTVRIAIYKDEQLTNNNLNSNNANPSDDFLIEYNFTSKLYSISLYVNAVILLLFTTTLLCISLMLRKEPELLAVNPYLNSLVFLGCYQLLIISVFCASQDYVELSSQIYIIFCFLKSGLGYSGIYLIASAVLARLVRVYRIFTHFGKLSRFWGNKYLFCVVLFISYLPDVFLGVCFSIDHMKAAYSEVYLLNENPPIAVLTPVCHSEGWLTSTAFAINLVYMIALVFLLLAFAILTRKVNKRDFKDTKKVTAFVVAFTFITFFLIILIQIFKSIGNGNIGGIVQSYLYQVIVLLSLVFLVAPKSLPAFYYRIVKGKRKRKYLNAVNARRGSSSITEIVVYSMRRMSYSSNNMLNSINPDERRSSQSSSSQLD